MYTTYVCHFIGCGRMFAIKMGRTNHSNLFRQALLALNTAPYEVSSCGVVAETWLLNETFLIWVSGHSDISGNQEADRVAR